MINSTEKQAQLVDYICQLDDAIAQKDGKKAETLQTEIIGVFESEIPGLKDNLSNYPIVSYDSDAPVDYIGDASLLKAKLQNYSLNLASGLYKPFRDTDGKVNVTQHVNQDVSTTVVVTIEQAIHNIQELPESVLSDEEKELLSGKLASISVEKDKEKRWKKISSALKWIAEKGIQVGIAALPYITKALEAAS